MLRIRVGRATDFSHEIRVGMTVYSGDAEPKIERIKELDKDGMNLTRIKIDSRKPLPNLLDGDG
jgi:kynurenine formamidase